jgi:DNA-binding CsgD family transcriptional regulator
MKRSVALAHFRQLSSLGLGGEAVIPALLETLHDLIPSSLNNFFWTDPGGQPVNAYVREVIPEVFETLAKDYHLFQAPTEPSLEHLAKSPAIVGGMAERFPQTVLRETAVFEAFYKPYRVGFSLDLVLRDEAGVRGIVFVSRELGARAFNAEETRLLGSLAPYVLHALDARPDATLSGGLVDAEDAAALLCDLNGRLVSAGGFALQLLQEAARLPLAPGAPLARPGDLLPEPIRRACASLAAIADGRPANAPAVTLGGPMGAIKAQVYPLGDDGAGGPLVVAHLRRQTPRALRVMQRLRTSPLSARQRQAAFQVGMGRGPDEARRRLGVGRETYRDYMRQIYWRLDIESRVELAARLN